MRVGILLLVISLPLFADERLPDGASLTIAVKSVRGDADCRLVRKGPWQAVREGMLLPVGAELCTGAGAAVWIDFGTNSVALVRESTLFRIDAFGMEGGRLVARVHIDPGVTSVSVAQREQFTTNFEVSTPRMTASIRGSGETVIANGDEVPDRVFVDEDFARIVYRSGERRGVREGGATNSDKAAPHDLATLHSLVDVTPQGASHQERASAELLASIAGSTDVVGSGLTLSQTSNPSTHFDPHPPARVEMDLGYTEQDLGHLVLAIGDVENQIGHDRDRAFIRPRETFTAMADTSLVQLPTGQGVPSTAIDSNFVPTSARQGVPSTWDPPDGEWAAANRPVLDRMGLRAFLDNYLFVQLERDFQDHWSHGTELVQDPAVIAQRASDFHHDAYGEGFDRFKADLHAAAQAAAAGRADLHSIGDAMIGVINLSWHMDNSWRPSGTGPGTYDTLLAQLRRQYIVPLERSLTQDPFGVFEVNILAANHARWHQATGAPDVLPPSDPRFAEHERFHQKLDALRSELDRAPHHAPPGR